MSAKGFVLGHIEATAAMDLCKGTGIELSNQCHFSMDSLLTARYYLGRVFQELEVSAGKTIAINIIESILGAANPDAITTILKPLEAKLLDLEIYRFSRYRDLDTESPMLPDLSGISYQTVLKNMRPMFEDAMAEVLIVRSNASGVKGTLFAFQEEAANYRRFRQTRRMPHGATEAMNLASQGDGSSDQGEMEQWDNRDGDSDMWEDVDSQDNSSMSGKQARDEDKDDADVENNVKDDQVLADILCLAQDRKTLEDIDSSGNKRGGIRQHVPRYVRRGRNLNRRRFVTSRSRGQNLRDRFERQRFRTSKNLYTDQDDGGSHSVDIYKTFDKELDECIPDDPGNQHVREEIKRRIGLHVKSSNMNRLGQAAALSDESGIMSASETFSQQLDRFCQRLDKYLPDWSGNPKEREEAIDQAREMQRRIEALIGDRVVTPADRFPNIVPGDCKTERQKEKLWDRTEREGFQAKKYFPVDQDDDLAFSRNDLGPSNVDTEEFSQELDSHHVNKDGDSEPSS
ncbi:MAG: hypothetical protein MJA30_26995, partial [Cytophagales bacterium]|nr:hypothetical protein [Cytophagales bacterium]